MIYLLQNNEIQDMQDRKRQDDQDKVVYYLAYPAACDPSNPVFLGFVSDLLVIGCAWVPLCPSYFKL